MSLIPRGVLLTGPPGTGKTLSARALAGKAPVPYFSISASEFVETFVGVGASLARDLVHAGQGKRAGEHLHRELDAIGRSRAGALARFGGGHDEREQTLNQIPRRGRRAVSRVRPSALPRTPASPGDR